MYDILASKKLLEPFTQADLLSVGTYKQVDSALQDGTAGRRGSSINQPPYIYAVALAHDIGKQKPLVRYYALPAVPRALILTDALDNAFVSRCRLTEAILVDMLGKYGNTWYDKALRAIGLRSVEFNEKEAAQLKKDSPECLICLDVHQFDKNYVVKPSTVAHIVTRRTCVRLTALYLDNKLAQIGGVFTNSGYDQFEQHIKELLWHRLVAPLCKAHDKDVRYTLWHSALPSWNPPVGVQPGTTKQKGIQWGC